MAAKKRRSVKSSLNLLQRKNRKKLEFLVWKYTHSDYKGKWSDGSKYIMRGKDGGSHLFSLDLLTDDALIAALPERIRTPYLLGL